MTQLRITDYITGNSSILHPCKISTFHSEYCITFLSDKQPCQSWVKKTTFWTFCLHHHSKQHWLISKQALPPSTLKGTNFKPFYSVNS